MSILSPVTAVAITLASLLGVSLISILTSSVSPASFSPNGVAFVKYSDFSEKSIVLLNLSSA